MSSNTGTFLSSLNEVLTMNPRITSGILAPGITEATAIYGTKVIETKEYQVTGKMNKTRIFPYASFRTLTYFHTHSRTE